MAMMRARRSLPRPLLALALIIAITQLFAASARAEGDDEPTYVDRWTEPGYAGLGFGLGFSVTLDPAAAQLSGSAGEYSWNGAAGTCWWIDPRHELSAVVMTQLLENDTDRLDRLMHREIYDENSQLRLRE